jgi:DNA polymerase (family 10)
MDNAQIAQTLEAYAALLDLAGASHYSTRAYRRAAELVRETPAPVAQLVRAGRARELRGIGPGIERRLTELVETGRLEELDELEREVEPQLVALGRFVGLGPQRMVAVGRALGVRTADELRAAAEAGRLREVPGIGPQTEQKILAGLARQERPRRRGVLINRARALAESIAEPLGAEIAGEVRRWKDVVYELSLVASEPVLDRFAGLPSVLARGRWSATRRSSSTRATSAATCTATRRGPTARRRSRRWRSPRSAGATSTSRSATTRRTSASCPGSTPTTSAGRARRSPP